VLYEWHLTPEYIDNKWTDEILMLMVQARGERLRKFADAQVPTNTGKERPPSCPRVVSDVELFKSMGVPVVKR
jgi:hypothetical protein